MFMVRQNRKRKPEGTWGDEKVKRNKIRLWIPSERHSTNNALEEPRVDRE
jgi:hypothetical protein